MDDGLFMWVCACVGAVALLLAQFVPAPVAEHDIRVQGTVERVFTPAGLTIATVRLAQPLSVVFLDGRVVTSGELIEVNASLERYQDVLELVVR